ncbi:MAG: PHP domain-containing protein, partial [Chloroflexi bacterium]|nr:PHP domain-containing protein [Chloroflexota bacterium]
MATETGGDIATGTGESRLQDRYDLPEPETVREGARNRVDLHLHTSRSDGVLTPDELYRQLVEYGIAVAAISDHDVLDAYRELRDAGRVGAGSADPVAGPLLIPAVEINAVAEHMPDLLEPELHILGYGVDIDDQSFELLMAGQRAARHNRVWALVDRLREIGMPIDHVIAETLPADVASAGRPHVARALVKAGHVESVQAAFDTVLTRGGPGYVPRQGLGVREAIEAIRAAGGLPVLAHFPAAPEVPE